MHVQTWVAYWTRHRQCAFPHSALQVTVVAAGSLAFCLMSRSCPRGCLEILESGRVARVLFEITETSWTASVLVHRRASFATRSSGARRTRYLMSMRVLTPSKLSPERMAR